MKLLTVAYNYPPIRGPEAIQANRLVKYTSKLNVNFEIVTRYIGNGKKFKNRIEEYGSINRAFSLDNFYVKGAMRVIGNDLENLPDAEILWYPFALRKAKKLMMTNGYNYIYTRSVPFTSHLIGLKLKKQFGLPWIAHFSDPWTDSPYVHYKKESTKHRNLEWEKSVVEQADKLIFTSRETIDLIMRKYDPSLRNKAYILPHTFDPESIVTPNIKTQNKPIRLSYVGNFYGNRTPADLFRAIELAKAEISNLEEMINFHFIGFMPGIYVSYINNSDLKKLVTYHGEMSYLESQREMTLSDALINIDAPSEFSVFLPSKVIEYLAYEKPIIALTPKGTVSRILSENGHICIQNNDHSALSRLIVRIATEGLSWIPFNKKAKEYFRPEKIAEEFIKIILD